MTKVDGMMFERATGHREVGRHDSAHDEPLRQIHDLQRAYAAERARRARAARSTMDLMMTLARNAAGRTDLLGAA